MRGLIRVGLAGVVVFGAVMTASPADADPAVIHAVPKRVPLSAVLAPEPGPSMG